MDRLQIGNVDDKEHYEIILDGKVVPDAYALEISKSFYALFGQDSLQTIAALSIGELKNLFSSTDIYLEEWEGLRGWEIGKLSFTSGGHYKVESGYVRAEVIFDMGCWNRPYGIEALGQAMSESFENIASNFRFWDSGEDGFMNGFGVEFSVEPSRTISQITSELPPKAHDLVRDAEFRLIENSETSVVRIFDFPEELRPACGQYLLYFGQFLRDLGLNAETELSERASNVLFTIRPSDRNAALDSIREALDCYLQIPGSAQASMLGSTNEIAILQLNANILHLKSQVALASALLQAKDATIGAQSTEIRALRESLDLRAYIPTAQVNQSRDSEEIVEGILAVKKVDYKGLEVNLPEILRRLKRFRR